MDHHNQGIRKKYQRHFRQTGIFMGTIVLMVGLTLIISLVIFWPQKYISDVFNSRLAYHLMIDVDDYLTCDKDYRNFIHDEPDADEALVSFYIFNVTNRDDVINRGYKPKVKQMGPYGFMKHTYKYNVSFDPSDESRISFREYSVYKDVPQEDAQYCRKMFHRMGRFYNDLHDPCLGGACECRSTNETISIINPLFLRFQKEETTEMILSRFSEEAYEDVKNLLENEFVAAVKSHLTYRSLQEIFEFRMYMQLGKLLNASFQSLRANFSTEYIANLVNTTATNRSDIVNCGLKPYGINGCPFLTLPDAIYHIRLVAVTQYPVSMPVNSFKDRDFPNVLPILDPASDISLFNVEKGLPLWIGLIYHQKWLEFNYGAGYTMVNSKEFEAKRQYVAKRLAAASFGANYASIPRVAFASDMIVRSITYWLARYWIAPYKSIIRGMAYEEWLTTYTPVVCTPLGQKCTWQWGYMVKYRGAKYPLTAQEVKGIIDPSTVSINNPVNYLYDGNLGAYYNTHLYCTTIIQQKVKETECNDYNFTNKDALINVPGALWAQKQGLALYNKTMYTMMFTMQPKDVQMQYIELACNISALQFGVYPTQLAFHDDYVVKYVNKNQRDASFNHTFTVGKWKEFGWAQFGAGIVTYAILGVRSTFQVVRNGMWRYGHEKYYSAMMEYGAWAIYQGFPGLMIHSVSDSKTLLYMLARRDEIGAEFRAHIVRTSTTLIGDGEHIVNNVGAVGEVAYIPEWPYGNFSCGGLAGSACKLLTYYNISSAGQCATVQAAYQSCYYEYYWNLNKWVTNCGRFATSETDPTNGVQCDKRSVRFHPHPYMNTRGNVLFAMIQVYAFDLQLRRGLFCDPVIYPGSAYSSSSTGLGTYSYSAETAECQYDLGGLFKVTKVRSFLFEGFSDPLIIKYLNLRHDVDGISFECADRPYDGCNLQLYNCNDAGLVLKLPNGKSHLLSYHRTPREEYFAPYFVVVAGTGELLWPYSDSPAKVQYAKSIISTTARVILVRNPIYAAYPAMNTDDKDFIKLWQRKNRLFNGMPDLFAAEEDTLNTGRKVVAKTLNIERLRGNATVQLLSPRAINRTVLSVGGSTANMQHPMSFWSGFMNYSYLYIFSSNGPNYTSLANLFVFHKQFGVSFELSQKSIFPAQLGYVIASVPFTDTYCSFSTEQCDRSNLLKTINITLRRFVEDSTTWENLRQIGTPVDTYGMPYVIPQGMTSIENLVGHQVFIGTANSWGNAAWGGLEFQQAVGMEDVVEAQQSQISYADYDPVTGRALRTAMRQQVTVRVETNALFMSFATGQALCTPPSKQYSQNTGYGCWGYVPLMWIDDNRLANVEQFYRMNDHFYTRVNRAKTLIVIGLISGFGLMFIGSCILIRESKLARDHRRRIYVD